jgi:ABC-type dipeptide/oligopeptide/nickel transport system permease component
LGKFLVRRILAIPITFILITMVLYGVIMLAPVESRIDLYMPNSPKISSDPVLMERIKQQIIKRYHLDEPYLNQYVFWLSNLLKGNWGYSPVLNNNVLPELLNRTPATLELLFYCMLLYIPLGLIAGVQAAYKREKGPDYLFRFSAFIGAAIPDFILSIILLAILYVNKGWFAPERLNVQNNLIVHSADFINYTGFLTIDGFLNQRADISLDAFRHLVMPVFTLGIAQWATLGRITRNSTIEEMNKDYANAARARGLSEKQIVWKHAFRNALGPALNSSALSTAMLITNVFVVERIFNINGISEMISMFGPMVPDAAAVLGFGVYCIILVLLLMFILDLLQALLLPRVREGTIENG